MDRWAAAVAMLCTHLITSTHSTYTYIYI